MRSKPNKILYKIVCSISDKKSTSFTMDPPSGPQPAPQSSILMCKVSYFLSGGFFFRSSLMRFFHLKNFCPHRKQMEVKDAPRPLAMPPKLREADPPKSWDASKENGCPDPPPMIACQRESFLFEKEIALISSHIKEADDEWLWG